MAFNAKKAEWELSMPLRFEGLPRRLYEQARLNETGGAIAGWGNVVTFGFVVRRWDCPWGTRFSGRAVGKAVCPWA